MTRIFAVFLLLAVQVFSFTIPQQHAINPSSEVAKSWPGGDPFDDEPWPHYPWGPWPPGNGLIQKLRRADIIPQVVYKFDPQVLLGALWNNEAAELGNHIHPIKVHSRPDVQLLRATSHNATGNSTLDRTQLTVIMTDPDAPSRWNPMWSEMCHWIVTNLTLTTVSTSPDSPTFKNSTIHRTPKEIVPYLSPAPPSFTGPHRYVLLVLAPKNRTSEALNLTTPTDRMHWGYKTGYARRGARRWANENGLEVIGANYFLSANWTEQPPPPPPMVDL